MFLSERSRKGLELNDSFQSFMNNISVRISIIQTFGGKVDM